jgi:hypothetical protein
MDFYFSTYHPKNKIRNCTILTPDVKIHIPRIAKFSTGQHFGVLGSKMEVQKHPTIWSNLGGWRYTKQYIIRRDFHGRLHPKLTLFAQCENRCFWHPPQKVRFLTPPKYDIFDMLQICTFCTFRHFCILRHDSVMLTIETRHVMKHMM